MKKTEVTRVLDSIVNDNMLPRSLKSSIENSMDFIGSSNSAEEKVSYLISLLDEASTNPNLSSFTRTHIWGIVSTLEGIKAGTATV